MASKAKKSDENKVKKIKARPAWDDSTSDVSALKATKEELERRKRIHQSHNRLGEPTEEGLASPSTSASPSASTMSLLLNPTPEAIKRRSAILKEIIGNSNDLRRVLARSDKAIDQVKDKFGDDPKRFTGVPNLTAAPTTFSPRQRWTSWSQPDVALRVYHCRCRAALQDSFNPPSVLFSPAGIKDERLAQLPQLALNEKDDFTDGSMEESAVEASPPHYMPSLSSNDLSVVMESLEKEISAYEEATGKPARPLSQFPKGNAQSLTGFTATLVDSLARLTKYLKESQVQLDFEVKVRGQLLMTLEQQQALIDTLSSDVLRVQEELLGYVHQFHEHRIQSEKQTMELQDKVDALLGAKAGDAVASS
eukprot:m.55302 g.55302  ORF g.55302 m.55302 type:complete len:365 (+) comp34452_c0_seq29:56-1150(+)